MTAEFVPILQKHRSPDIETFVTGSESADIATNIFVSAGLMIFAMIITWLFIWSYQKDKFLFITIISLVALCFALEVVVLVLINMNKYDQITFRVSLGSAVLVGFIYFILAVIFMSRFFQNQRSSNSYVPSSVQSYIEH
jgi:ABC-type multidrug transport system fused ATPase/permease subunit